EALFAPEFDDLGVQVFGRLADDQPAQRAVAHDFDAGRPGQHTVGRIRALHTLAGLVVAQAGDAFGRHIVGVLVGLRQVGGDRERIARDGTLVFDGFGLAGELTDGRAGRQ